MRSSWGSSKQIEMVNLSGPERERYVQAMFGRIASRYDLMNRLMTAGQDVRWRREVIRRSQLPPGGGLLDLGAGTGDLAREARRQVPGSWVVAADFTMEMMQVGRERSPSAQLDWLAADARVLPFTDNHFDAIVSGFLLRNVINIPQCLREQHRILKPGGFMVVLDTTKPPQNSLQPLVNYYLYSIIPALGRIIAGDGEAYTYLPETTGSFLKAEQLAEMMVLAGFQQVSFHRLMLGTIAIHWGRK